MGGIRACKLRKRKNIVLVGDGGHAKVVIEIIRSIGMYDIIGIADIREKKGMVANEVLIKIRTIPSLNKVL